MRPPEGQGLFLCASFSYGLALESPPEGLGLNPLASDLLRFLKCSILSGVKWTFCVWQLIALPGGDVLSQLSQLSNYFLYRPLCFQCFCPPLLLSPPMSSLRLRHSLRISCFCCLLPGVQSLLGLIVSPSPFSCPPSARQIIGHLSPIRCFLCFPQYANLC